MRSNERPAVAGMAMFLPVAGMATCSPELLYNPGEVANSRRRLALVREAHEPDTVRPAASGQIGSHVLVASIVLSCFMTKPQCTRTALHASCIHAVSLLPSPRVFLLTAILGALSCAACNACMHHHSCNACMQPRSEIH